MLKREWPLKLGVALKAQFVDTGRVEIVSRTAAMWIMAIDATHLGFADRVMVGQVGLGFLLPVALQALVVLVATGLDRPGLASNLAAAGSKGHSLAMRPALVNGMAVDAANVVRGMSAGEPIPDVIGLGVAPQADAIGFFGLDLAELDDLLVGVAGEMQAAGPVTVFAFHGLLRVITVSEGLALFLVAGAALVGTEPLGARNVHELGERLVRAFLLVGAGRGLLSDGKLGQCPEECQ